MRTLAIWLLLASSALAGDSMMTIDPNSTWDMAPPSLVYTGEGGRMIFTIHPDGKVEIGKDVPMDEAAREFWKAIKQMGFQCVAHQ